jgi:chemotaxis signal transduction protein
MTLPPSSRQTKSSAVASLLDRALDPADLREATERVARRDISHRALTQTNFVFRLGPEWLALPNEVIDEVLVPRAIHSLPHHQGGIVRGLVNVRGQLTICVRLESLLQLNAAAAKAGRTGLQRLSRRLVVLMSQGHRVAFEADEVHGANRFDPDSSREVPATVTHSMASFTRGVLPWGDYTVGQLDAELLLHAINRQLA